jgi:hypothetical protein
LPDKTPTWNGRRAKFWISARASSQIAQRMSRTISLTILFSFLAGSGFSQNKSGDFTVSKISRDLMTSPDYSYTGAEQLRSTRERWLRVEVQFSATPDFTDELTFSTISSSLARS